MNTLKITANPLLSDADLKVVIDFLRKGQLVAIPTETVYGLAADLFQDQAVQGIFSVKGRPQDNPLIAHVSDELQVVKLLSEVPSLFEPLAKRFWPGPLTFVMRRRADTANQAAAHLPTIAVRMPSHPCAIQIIREFGSPLGAPSANLSGRPSSTSAEDVLEDFQGKIAAVVDGGESCLGIESTVISLLEKRPILLRPGAIARNEIEDFLGFCLKNPSKEEPVLSPGMKYRHYAPKAHIHLVDSRQAFEQLVKCPHIYVPDFICSQNLYSHLRKADRLGFAEMAIYLDDRIQSDEALMNRLVRAASSC